MAAVIAYRFGAHRLEPAGRRLLADGQALKLGGRAFDLLVALVERRERTVSKDELLDVVWPRLVVEENNLQVQVAALRRQLGNEAIATVPGRGYRFTLPVVVDGPSAGPPAADVTAGSAPVPPPPVPPAVVPPALLGRDDELAALPALLASARLVTLAGPGGIGKTRLARAALDGWAEGGAWVELAPLADAQDVAAAAARALGVAAGEQAAQAVVAALTAAPRLLVLDNAEHLLPGVAALAAAVLAQAPQARLLVTSQEVLRLPQEQVLRVAPLSLPQAPGLPAARAAGAVALFAARARAADRRFVLDEGNVEAVVEVCRRLDGIPLAIELAAARLPLLGAAGLRERLDDRFRLLSAGPRGALPRQQTLRATLEWSHGLLDEPAQRVFRRLGVFVGGFAIEAAEQVAADDTLDAWGVLDQLGTLVDKSLLLVDGGEPPRYRLLETTRLFALERLQAAGEAADCRRRHAQATAARVRQVRSGARAVTAGVYAALAAEADNALAAMQWAAAEADAALGVQVATEASFAFMGANRHAEFIALALPWVDAAERGAVEPAPAAALLRRVAAVGKSSGGALALRAALAAATRLRAGAGTPRELQEALVAAVALGARRGEPLPFEALLAEAQALHQPDWPPAPLANWHWARERWLMRAGRYAEAAASARAQAEAMREHAAVGAPQTMRINAAGCELAQGRVAEAEALARAAIEDLAQASAQRSAAGYGWAVVAACEARRGAWDDALASCRRARPALEMEGDDLQLLPTLAAVAAGRGRPQAAAQLAGHLDASRARSGSRPEPAEAAERERLHAALAAVLGAEALAAALARGARLSRGEALALGFESPGHEHALFEG